MNKHGIKVGQWRSLRDAMSRRRRPDGISAKQIREAAALLGFALEEQK